MKKRGLLIVLLVLGLAFFGLNCGSDEDEGGGGQPGDQDTIEEQEGTTGTCEGANEGGKNVGEPCESGDECYSGDCMTTQSLNSLGIDAEMPNGYCTGFMIGEDEACKCTNAGGIWVDLLAWTGFPGSGLCLVPCESDDDCRKDEGYGCFDPADVFGDYSDYPECVKEIYQGKKGCLSNDLIEQAIAEPPDPSSINCPSKR